MRKIFLSLITVLSMVGMVRADEGMFLPYSLNGTTLGEMQRLGCELTAEQIFNLNQPSVKDAIVQFGGGCTGELISPEGLLLTNHHCGLSYVQKHASVEHDYLTDGFWALSKQEELPNAGLTVSFLTYVEDVTNYVTNNGADIDNSEVIAENLKKLINERKGDRDVTIEVEQFYHGNQYILFEYDVYSDVRLVCCPPWGIGKYGADTDNWTWPRHKGDFNIFRVYTNKDGKPAKYSADNIPMKSKWYLPINIKGVQPGDYTMILGYPGSTDRYSSARTINNIVNEEGPAIITCRTTKLDTYRRHMDADQAVFIKYASKQASVSNYWKYYIGQVKQLKRNKVEELRLAQEELFKNWIGSDATRREEYKNMFEEIDAKWDVLDDITKAFVYHREAGIRGSEAVAFASSMRRMNELLKDKKNNKESIEKSVVALSKYAETYFKDYDYALDLDVTINLLNLFYKDIKDYAPTMLTEIGDKNHGDFSAWVDKVFAKSIFTDKERFDKWLKNPKKLDKEPIFALCVNFIESYNGLLQQYLEASEKGQRAERLFMKGLQEMQQDRNFYPDANFTMRLTYGTVQPYDGADAIHYNYVTTMDGVMAKYVPGNWEFDIPQDVRDLYAARDYGRYADTNGQLIVNFITTNDITGGNSGSPVINGRGELVGLAFDGNWEAMSGDLNFEQKTQRTICMDARYLLWCIEKVGKAQNIIDELTVIE